jgi:hypothetical protein
MRHFGYKLDERLLIGRGHNIMDNQEPTTAGQLAALLIAEQPDTPPVRWQQVIDQADTTAGAADMTAAALIPASEMTPTERAYAMQTTLVPYAPVPLSRPMTIHVILVLPNVTELPTDTDAGE